jgi:hypothetical protein
MPRRFGPYRVKAIVTHSKKLAPGPQQASYNIEHISEACERIA